MCFPCLSFPCFKNFHSYEVYNVFTYLVNVKCWPTICVWMLRIFWVTNNIPIFPYAWHVLKAWHLHVMEKIKDVEVQRITFHDLHDVMYMSIEPKENIETFKKRGKMKVIESFEHHSLGDSWTHYFCTYYYQFDMCSFSILIFQNKFVWS